MHKATTTSRNVLQYTGLLRLYVCTMYYNWLFQQFLTFLTFLTFFKKTRRSEQQCHIQHHVNAMSAANDLTETRYEPISTKICIKRTDPDGSKRSQSVASSGVAVLWRHARPRPCVHLYYDSAGDRADTCCRSYYWRRGSDISRLESAVRPLLEVVYTT